MRGAHLKQTTSSLNRPANVAAVVLAAGPSKRMGRPKQLLEFRGEALLKRAASSAVEAGCHPVVVVTGAHADASRRVLGELDVIEAKNEQWKLGISSSVRVGIEAVIAAAPGVDGIVLMLCDQPFVTREIIAGLIPVTPRITVCRRYLAGSILSSLSR